MGVAGRSFGAQGFEQSLEVVGGCGHGLGDLGLDGAGGGDVEMEDGAFGGEGDVVGARYFDFERGHFGGDVYGVASRGAVMA